MKGKKNMKPLTQLNTANWLYMTCALVCIALFNIGLVVPASARSDNSKAVNIYTKESTIFVCYQGGNRIIKIEGITSFFLGGLGRKTHIVTTKDGRRQIINLGTQTTCRIDIEIDKKATRSANPALIK